MLILVAGAVRSGKSTYAEKLLTKLSHPKDLKPLTAIYLATAVPYDEEMQERICHHVINRKEKRFETVEQPYHLGGAVDKIPQNSSVLFECLGTLTGNELASRFDKGLNNDDVYDDILNGINAITDKAKNFIIVSNEVFSDGIEYTDISKDFVDILSGLHKEIAKRADVVVECVYGQNIVYKGQNFLTDLEL